MIKNAIIKKIIVLWNLNLIWRRRFFFRTPSFLNKEGEKMEKVKLMNMCKIIDPTTKKVLVQERIKSWKGVAFPGGKIEPGESIVPSVKREVHEETGLKLNSVKICGVKDWYDKKEKERQLIILFTSDDYSGDIISETSEGKIYWIDEDELKKAKLADDFDKLLKVFKNEEINEYVQNY